MAMLKSSSSSVGYNLVGALGTFIRPSFYRSNKMPPLLAPLPPYNPTPTANTCMLLPFSSSSSSSTSNRSISQNPLSNPDFGLETTKRPPTQPPAAAPASSWPIPAWVKWVMGWIISVAFPFWKQRWDHLLALQGEAEMVIKEAEEVAEVVEKVALATENMSARVADNLPAEQTRLKEAALFVQNLSHDTAQHAQSLSNIIHKVDDLKQDLEELEDTIVVKKTPTHN